jgi:8-oxo-dGTP pyrophosphatase MutT (NUDIX family)
MFSCDIAASIPQQGVVHRPIIGAVSSPANLRKLLLSPEEAAAMDAPGKTDAAVLVPLFLRDGRLVAVFTERRDDLRRHAGEISFPGGRQDEPDEDLRRTALREAQEEIGLSPASVEIVGALPPVGTFVTGYRVYPFVGVIAEDQSWVIQETEVAKVLELSLADLVAGHESKRLIRRGVPIKTPTYTVDGHFVWGATARMVQALLGRLEPVLGS